jgi:hypothetical protein
MPKGMFTQVMCLLTDGRTTIEDVKSALLEQAFEIVKQTPPGKNSSFGGPAFIVPFLPAVNGFAAVDVVSESWPDSMGDPKSDPMRFGAWAMGGFGPFAYPGGLNRARQHSWGWQPGRTVPESHRGFIRFRVSYVFGADAKAPVLPKAYDPLAELHFLSRMVLAVFQVPGVLCYFNPNGEALYDCTSFRKIWNACREQEKLPLPLWVNVRFFSLNDHFAFMDTVGNRQLDVSDVEAIFPQAECDPGDIGYYLRNVTHYLLEPGTEIKIGESIDGPGETDLSWTAEALDNGMIQPPRPILRLYPKSCRKAVQSALALLEPSGCETKGPF